MSAVGLVGTLYGLYISPSLKDTHAFFCCTLVTLII